MLLTLARNQLLHIQHQLQLHVDAHLLWLGSVRFIGPNARLMIHQPSTISRGKASDIESDSNVINSMTQQFVYDRCDKAAGKESGYTKKSFKRKF